MKLNYFLAVVFCICLISIGAKEKSKTVKKK
jgi:hypothetical protein